MKPLPLLALVVLVLAGVVLLWPCSPPGNAGGPGESPGGGEAGEVVAVPLPPPPTGPGPAGGRPAGPPAVAEGGLRAAEAAGAPEPRPGAQSPEAGVPGGEDATGAAVGGAAPAGPDAGAVAAALTVLDQWHRALEADRDQAAGEATGPVRSCLQALAVLLDPAPEAAPPPFPVEAAGALGQDFTALARAWRDGGTAGLARELGAGTGAGGPAALVWQEVLVRQGTLRGDSGRASTALGELLRGMLEAGYPRDRVLELAPVARSLARDAASYLPFRSYVVQAGDSLIRIARRFRQQGLELRYGWIRLFNDKAGDTVQVGEELRIPTTPLHLEVWRSARVAVLFAGEHPLRVESVSVGKPGEETPLGTFTIQEHDARPKWYRRDGPPLPYGDPENALGEGWMGFKEKTSYGLHGTNQEETLGSFETQGCIRFRNEAIVELMELLPVGAKVVIHP